MGDNPVSRYDPYGLWTVQLAWSVNLQLGPVNFQKGIGFAVDGNGNLGFYNYRGAGSGIGKNWGVGFSLQTSNANTICDLRKYFATQTVALGDVAEGAVDTFEGTQANGQLILGAGFGAGIGEGASVSDTLTYTTVTPMGRL